MLSWISNFLGIPAEAPGELSNEELGAFEELLSEREDEIRVHHRRAIESIKVQQRTLSSLSDKLEDIRARAEDIADGDEDGH